MIQFPEASPSFGENSPEARVYAHVQNLLTTLGAQLHSVSLASVADALGWSSDRELRRAIVRALDQLSFGEPSILERHFLLWPSEDDDAVLSEPLGQISDLEMRRALESEVLTLAETGEQVTDFMDRITVEYVLRDEVRGLIDVGQVKKS